MKATYGAAFAGLLMIGSGPMQTVPKLALIDAKVVLENAPGSDQAKKMLDGELAVFQAVVSRWSDSLTAMKKKLQDEEATLSPSVRTNRQKEIDDRLERYQRGNDSLTRIMQKRQQEVMQPVLDLVNKEIGDLRTEEGYSLILDLEGAGQFIIAYDKNLDITDKVVARVKKKPAPALPAATNAAKPGAPAAGAAGVKPPPGRGGGGLRPTR